MFGHQYSNDIIRKTTIAFGNLFNDMYIKRRNSSGTAIQTIKIPISYVGKQRYLQRLRQDPNLNKKAKIQLPLMSFELMNMSYDSSRKKNSLNRISESISTDQNNSRTVYYPVPYNLDFDLNIYVKNANDGLQIVEQILPFFTPDITLKIDYLDDMNKIFDVPVILTAVSKEDSYEGDYKGEERIQTWTLSFSIKTVIFGPVRKDSIIKFVQVDSHLGVNVANNDLSRVSRLTVQPGLLANGSPTSNLSLTVDKSTITANDNFGLIEQIFIFDDGKIFNPVTGEDE